MSNNYGYVRETQEAANKDLIDPDTGLCRTGLDIYLNAIFPNSTWIHDKVIKDSNGNTIRIGGKALMIRPDYRCEELKLIVEFDGIPHYTKPDVMAKDMKNTKIYEDLGYKVVRIPFFIQLTNTAVKTLFDVDVSEPLFPEGYASIGPLGQNTPAYMCHMGLIRMANEFKRFPSQYKVNIESLQKYEHEHPERKYLTESQLLISIYESL